MMIAKLKNHLRTGKRHAQAFAKEHLSGAPKRYEIRAGYVHRTKAAHFDDTSFRDEYQREVYERAAELARENGVRTIYDIGCGSGFKLIKYLGDFETVGFDVPQTLEYLRSEYPDRRWDAVSFSDRHLSPADMVICSDVIEHVLDPDELMRFLVSVTGEWLILSTPDRARAYSRFSPYQLGPPSSEHHMREWSADEFRSYVSRFVDVVEHAHPNPEHSTLMIVARIRKDRGEPGERP